MKIYQSIFRRGRKGGNAGSYANQWTLRLTHFDDRENKTVRVWQYGTKQDAKDDIEKRKAELVASVETKGLDLGDIDTFRQWASFAKANFYKPAIIREGRKVEGVKSHRATHILIDHLVECFGDKPLAKFTKYDLDHYKSWRLKQGDLRGEKGKLEPKERNPVSLSTVNRGLSVLKHLLIEANDAGLIAKNVTKGSKAIDADAETARKRTITDEEEKRLLPASEPSIRPVTFERNSRGLGEKKSVAQRVKTGTTHLKAIIFLALDSGMRRGEILKVEWEDIDFNRGLIRILGTHTKTQKARLAPMTRRTRAELERLPNFGEHGRVFRFNDFKRSWATALRVAKIVDLDIHDLRRTCSTRMELLGVPHAIVQKILGHSDKDVTGRHYVAATEETVQMVAERLDAYAENGGLPSLFSARGHNQLARAVAADGPHSHWPDTIE